MLQDVTAYSHSSHSLVINDCYLHGLLPHEHLTCAHTHTAHCVHDAQFPILGA